MNFFHGFNALTPLHELHIHCYNLVLDLFLEFGITFSCYFIYSINFDTWFYFTCKCLSYKEFIMKILGIEIYKKWNENYISLTFFNGHEHCLISRGLKCMHHYIYSFTKITIKPLYSITSIVKSYIQIAPPHCMWQCRGHCHHVTLVLIWNDNNICFILPQTIP